MNLKHFGFFTALFIISVSAFPQLEKKIIDENVVNGVIIKDGKEIQGYIKLMGYTSWDNKTYEAPWQFQSDIRFIEKSVFEQTEKIKNKMFETYGPKDIEGYKYDTLVYESLKYADMSAVGMNMLPKKVFMRKVKDGKISLYNYFDSPPVVTSGPEGFAPYYIECANPQWVYKKGSDGKPQLVNGLNIEKELADCPYVTEKNSKGEYKILGKEGEETTGLKKLANKTIFREAVCFMAIEDYNKNCK